jgi:outer membrane receptor for ferrienterochelin and colicin
MVASLAAAVLPRPGVAQHDVTGTVRDSINNEALPNAEVTVSGASRHTITDAFGRFTIVALAAGPQTIRVEYIGYRPQESTIDVGASTGPLTILLGPQAIELEGVVVETSTDIVQAGGKVSQVTLSPRNLGSLPSLGEPDVFRSLQLLPGVSGTNDATSGLFVRGGTPDENLVLLDGMTVYHVDHFFGVFSAFNSDAIKDVTLMKGGFPAQFGGRTSSVVEMVGKSGDNEDFNMSAGLNMLSARAVTEVPLGGRGSWLVSARRSYTDLIRTPLYNGIFGTLRGDDEESEPGPSGFNGRQGPGGFGAFNQQSTTPSFYFYDLNSKLSYAPSSRDVVTLSVYAGEDRLDESTAGQEISAPDGQSRTTPDRIDRTEWGNRGASGRWSRQWGTRVTTDVLAAYSAYFSEGQLDVAAPSAQLARGFQEDNRVEDFTARLDNTWQPAEASRVGFGAQVTRNTVGYEYFQVQGDSVRGGLDLGSTGTTAAVFVQHAWTPSSRFELTTGVRGTSYSETGDLYGEPRLSAQLALTDRVRLKGAWGRYYQFVKRVENEDILEGSRDFWVLAGDDLPPSFAEHRIVGASYESDRYLFDAEAFHKDLDGVSQFSTRARQRPDDELIDFFFSGTGAAKGVELLAQRKHGNLTGWISYTLSEVEHLLVGFNDDTPFPASHDERHELKAVASYQWNRWILSSSWAFGSGRPYTIPESQYTIALLDGRSLSYINVGPKNGERLPAYHRLDLSATRRFETASLFYELNFTLINAYGRNNVWYRQFDLSESPLLITDVTTLGFTPSIGFRVGLR